MKKQLFFLIVVLSVLTLSAVGQEIDSLRMTKHSEYSTQSETEEQQSLIPYYDTNFSAQFTDLNLMIRNINAETDKYTGVVNVNIPVYEIQTNAQAIPISLRYQTTGIRLDDNASEVGLGWRLAAGGRITRVVHGEPDNRKQLKTVDDLVDGWDCDDYDDIMENFWDTQPDVYYFELPNGGGSFVFDTDGNPHTIPYQQVKIEYVSDYFVIYDGQGMKYTFKTKQEARDKLWGSDHAIQYVSTWFLNEIEFIDGGTVKYTYETGTDYEFGLWNYLACFSYLPNPFQLIDYRRNATLFSHIIAPKYLSTISCNEQQIRFYYDRNRKDFLNTKRLIRCEVYSGEERCRTFKLAYGAFPDDSPKLLQIYEEPDSTLRREICSFDYYEDKTFPVRNRMRGYYGFDHWNFCNTDVADPVPFPDIKYWYPSTSIQTSRKAPVLEFTRAQSLKRINYPNGGTREFIYELHRGRNQITGAIEDAGGLRIKEIIERESNKAVPSVTRYEYDDGIIYDDAFNYIAHFGGPAVHISSRSVSPTTDQLGSSVVYSSVTEYLPNGSYIRYNYVPYEEYPDIDPIETRFSGPIRAIKGQAPKTQRAWGRSLLRSKEWFASDGGRVRREEYHFLIDTSQMVKIPSRMLYVDYPFSTKYIMYFDEYLKNRYLAKNEHISCPVLRTHTNATGNGVLSSDTFIFYNELNLPSTTMVKGREGANLMTHQKFTSDYSLPDGHVNSKLLARNALLPVETVTYINGKVVEAELDTYRVNENNEKSIVLSETSGLKYKQAIDSARFRLSSVSDGQIVYDQRYYDTLRFYDDYDQAGNLLCYHDRNGMYHSAVYYPGYTFPAAFVDNARNSIRWGLRTNQVYFDDFERSGIEYPKAKSGNRVGDATKPHYILTESIVSGKYILSYWYKTSDASTWNKYRKEVSIGENRLMTYHVPIEKNVIYIDDLALIPINATIRSEVKRAGIGKLSETDEQGLSVYYEYNALGLPSKIYDNDRILINKYTYDNYEN